MEEFIQLKEALYTGICIYNEIKSCKIKIQEVKLTPIDKKNLALYLGIMCSKNKISKYLKIDESHFNITVNYKKLNDREYMDLYNEEFYKMFNNIGFRNIEEYFNYLLRTNIVQIFNHINSIKIEQDVKESNKILTKQIV